MLHNEQVFKVKIPKVKIDDFSEIDKVERYLQKNGWVSELNPEYLAGFDKSMVRWHIFDGFTSWFVDVPNHNATFDLWRSMKDSAEMELKNVIETLALFEQRSFDDIINDINKIDIPSNKEKEKINTDDKDKKMSSKYRTFEEVSIEYFKTNSSLIPMFLDVALNDALKRGTWRELSLCLYVALEVHNGISGKGSLNYDSDYIFREITSDDGMSFITHILDFVGCRLSVSSLDQDK